MADNWRRDSTRQAKAARIDTTVPNPVRVADYLVGGRDNFEADRHAVRTLVALLTSTPAGAVAAVDPHVTDPRAILSGAAQTLDLGQPVAILLMATPGYIVSSAAAAVILLPLAGAVPAGSHVALYHQASDLDPAVAATARLVPVTEWHPAPDDPRFDHAVPVYSVVARKP